MKKSVPFSWERAVNQLKNAQNSAKRLGKGVIARLIEESIVSIRTNPDYLKETGTKAETPPAEEQRSERMTESYWNQGHREISSEAPFDELPVNERGEVTEPRPIETVQDLGKYAVTGNTGETFDTKSMTIIPD